MISSVFCRARALFPRADYHFALIARLLTSCGSDSLDAFLGPALASGAAALHIKDFRAVAVTICYSPPRSADERLRSPFEHRKQGFYTSTIKLGVYVIYEQNGAFFVNGIIDGNLR
jgi:hypothetical protein